MGAHTKKLEFQAQKMEYRSEIVRRHPRLQGRQMPPEIAAVIGHVMSDVWAFVGGVLTISTIGIVQTGLALNKVDATEIVLKAAGWSAGLVALGRLVMSDPVTFWWEQIGDGIIDTILAVRNGQRREEYPEEEYPEETIVTVQGGTNEATTLYHNARHIYDYAHDILAAERREGIRNRSKAWSKRQVTRNLDVDQEAWSRAISLWIEAGIIENSDSTELLIEIKSAAAAMLRHAMVNRGYIEITPRGATRGTGIWIPKES
jgi:hypothetical protein